MDSPYLRTPEINDVYVIEYNNDGSSEGSDAEYDTNDEDEAVAMEEEAAFHSPDEIVPPMEMRLQTPIIEFSTANNMQHSTPKKEVTAYTAEASTSTTLPRNDTTTDEDGQTCTICFEQWTNSSEHRLVSLRCGHLFGRSCITRWLKGQNARCPQCNARARKSEIRNIYAKAVKVIDSSERDKALRDLQNEIELRRKAEITAATERLKQSQMHNEMERLKKELMDANRVLQEYRNGLYNKLEKTQASTANAPLFLLSKCIDINKKGGCRIIDTCDMLDWAIISQSSSNDLFPGYGFRKVSFSEMKLEEFTIVHQKPIKDMAFHANNGLVLTASLDKSVKITNTLTNSVVHTYPVEFDVWSCAWDADDSSYFYAGLKTGNVYVFDIRVTSRYVKELPQFGFRTPAASLQYVKKSPGLRKGGLVVGKLSDCAFFQKEIQAEEYKIFYPPTMGPYSSLSSEPSSGHVLISSRPSPKQPRVTHTVCEVQSDAAGDLVCNPVQSVLGGRTHVQLTRSKLLPHPDDPSSLLICAGDEDASGALIWDGSSGKCLAQLKTDPAPVVDLAQMRLNHKSHLLALTDKTLRIYQWNA